MVFASRMGCEARYTRWREESLRGGRTQVGDCHAPHVDGRNRFPLRQDAHGVCLAFVSASLVCSAEDAGLGQSVSIPVRLPCQHAQSAWTTKPCRAPTWSGRKSTPDRSVDPVEPRRRSRTRNRLEFGCAANDLVCWRWLACAIQYIFEKHR